MKISRFLSLIFLTPALLTASQLNVSMPGPFVPQSAASINLGPADTFLDMAGNVPTTPITAGVMATGTQGFANMSGAYTVTGTGLTVGADQASCHLPGTLSVNNTSYPTSHSSQSFSVLNTTGSNYVTGQLAAVGGNAYGPKIVNSFGCLVLGPPNSNNGNFDLLRFNAGAGFSLFQLTTDGVAGDYGLRIEVNPGTTSSTIVLTSQETVFYFFQANEITGTCTLKAWTTGGSLIGTVTVAQDTTFPYGSFYLGNSQTGTSTGAITYFENTMISWSNVASTISPIASWAPTKVITNVTLAENSASANTLAVTIPALGSGHALHVITSTTNTTPRTVSKVCTDGATCAANHTFTQDTDSGAHTPASTQGNARADSWSCFNCASGATTVTITYSGAATFREAAVFETSGDSAIDVSNHTNSGSASSSVITGASLTTTGTYDFIYGLVSVADSVTQAPRGTNEFTNGYVFVNTIDGVAYTIAPTAAAHAPTFTDSAASGVFGSSASSFK